VEGWEKCDVFFGGSFNWMDDLLGEEREEREGLVGRERGLLEREKDTGLFDWIEEGTWVKWSGGEGEGEIGSERESELDRGAKEVGAKFDVKEWGKCDEMVGGLNLTAWDVREWEKWDETLLVWTLSVLRLLVLGGLEWGLLEWWELVWEIRWELDWEIMGGWEWEWEMIGRWALESVLES
jgi:hypothetical protein